MTTLTSDTELSLKTAVEPAHKETTCERLYKALVPPELLGQRLWKMDMHLLCFPWQLCSLAAPVYEWQGNDGNFITDKTKKKHKGGAKNNRRCVVCSGSSRSPEPEEPGQGRFEEQDQTWWLNPSSKFSLLCLQQGHSRRTVTSHVLGVQGLPQWSPGVTKYLITCCQLELVLRAAEAKHSSSSPEGNVPPNPFLPFGIGLWLQEQQAQSLLEEGFESKHSIKHGLYELKSETSVPRAFPCTESWTTAQGLKASGLGLSLPETQLLSEEHQLLACNDNTDAKATLGLPQRNKSALQRSTGCPRAGTGHPWTYTPCTRREPTKRYLNWTGLGLEF